MIDFVSSDGRVRNSRKLFEGGIGRLGRTTAFRHRRKTPNRFFLCSAAKRYAEFSAIPSCSLEGARRSTLLLRS
jgi:hypothetical protein